MNHFELCVLYNLWEAVTTMSSDKLVASKVFQILTSRCSTCWDSTGSAGLKKIIPKEHRFASGDINRDISSTKHHLSLGFPVGFPFLFSVWNGFYRFLILFQLAIDFTRDCNLGVPAVRSLSSRHPINLGRVSHVSAMVKQVVFFKQQDNFVVKLVVFAVLGWINNNSSSNLPSHLRLSHETSNEQSQPGASIATAESS